MFQFNKSVEKIEVGNGVYLGDFESGALVKLDNHREKIIKGFE